MPKIIFISYWNWSNHSCTYTHDTWFYFHWKTLKCFVFELFLLIMINCKPLGSSVLCHKLVNLFQICYVNLDASVICERTAVFSDKILERTLNNEQGGDKSIKLTNVFANLLFFLKLLLSCHSCRLTQN